MPFAHRRSRLPGAAVILALALALSACTSNTPQAASTAGGSASGPIGVTSTDDACTLTGTQAPSGTVTFRVTNQGNQVTEFYLFAEDGVRIVGEVENIGPGLSRDLIVQAPAGTYRSACKPGMSGDGIRADFTVTDSGKPVYADASSQQLLSTATTQYQAYVKEQTEQLLTGTTAFVAAVKRGDAAAARAAYAPTRTHWERIEPVAESFGDLDPRMDAREADLEKGQAWTGWHRLEKDLWPPATGYTALTAAQRATVADRLLADTQELAKRTTAVKLTPAQLGNGAKELLDEVATGKITGEEEAFSHTDLWDFQANVDGARIAFTNLRPALEAKNKPLATTISARFDALQKELDQYRQGDGFVSYEALTPAQIKTLSTRVDALSEPLAKLTGAVVA
ncbi:lipoprotein [Tersicoccus solisilvae]|uniref:Lipoprotein n=1 Tax=Tersicoccus solisilvae TaxID=1882339 RepID=A0ABQ1NJR6_9MICC|nr:iron uptake system protein EfeO [Tersicoccus solisilvae]GGC78899.1 lipoprotein [Tersicoccus solisilvae]